MSSNIPEDLTIPEDSAGKRIDVVLASLLPEFSRSQLSHWLQTGVITIDGKTFKPKTKVHGGELITLTPEKMHSISVDEHNQPENIPLEICFEDESLLVINKPPGLVVHPGAGNREHTLLNALLYHAPELENIPRAGIIHRLDKDTSGLLVIAKTLTAQTHLTREMQAREIKRHYTALVHGHVIAGNTIDTYFGRHSKNRLKMAVTNSGRQAITEYRVQTQYQYYTLLNVELMTGRTHQIRVHLAHINHPIVGDQLYGKKRSSPPPKSDEALLEKLSSFERQALHARLLNFKHPISKKPLTFEAPLPDDFSSLLVELERYVKLLSC